MEDFDIFTDQIEFTKPFYKNVLHRLVYEAPSTPNGPNYQSGQKLLAEECLAENDDVKCAFHLSEAVSSSIRMMAIYREEQIKAAGNKLQKITSYIKPVNDLTKLHSISKSDQKLLDLLSQSEDITASLKKFQLEEDLPFHKQYLKFSKENNVDNFQRILKELPKEWTVIQLTAPYNPNENLKPVKEYRKEMDCIQLSVFTNDYMDGISPFTINVPANVTKEGELPLFTELYSILEENYTTIDNAQFLNNKRLVQNYWNRREDIDLRLMSVINVMDKEWLGGWGSLVTGRLLDDTWKEKVIQLVDNAISDWGFIRLTNKQRLLLYNLIESCQALSSHQIKSCIRRILTEHGNPADVRQALHTCDKCTKQTHNSDKCTKQTHTGDKCSEQTHNSDKCTKQTHTGDKCSEQTHNSDKCTKQTHTGDKCSRDFTFVNELCFKCLAQCFEAVHHFSLVDGIRAFSQVALQVKEGDEWTGLKKAKRHPVILIVDEMLDTFPWESLPILKHHPVSRIENIHFLYYLYRTHQSRVIDGYFEMGGDEGRYVINPEKNLDRMEKRMSSFVRYWCESWRGHIAEPPPPNDFIHYLRNADIFLYCGHGDGCHFANGGGNGAGVEDASGAKAVCILSGCGSVRLGFEAGRAPPFAAHRRLHIAGSPCVVGMLWEVTDLEVDKVVSTLLSLFVPSRAPRPWPDVGKTSWSQGELDTSVEQKCQFVPERDLLRAVARSRGSTNYAMIGSSVVARGLPVRITQS